MVFPSGGGGGGGCVGATGGGRGGARDGATGRAAGECLRKRCLMYSSGSSNVSPQSSQGTRILCVHIM